MSSSDLVVILTALDVEYAAVRARMLDIREKWHPKGTRFETGRFPGGDCQIALVLVNKGNHSSAVLATRAIEVFDPLAVLFVGVAGALRDGLALGDVVVATHVYAYHGATSEDDGAKARPRCWEIDHRADQMARHVARTGDWLRLRDVDGAAPVIHFGPIAAGEVVLNSRTSAHAHWVREHYNDAVAIEMEAAGVAQAAHLNDNVPVVVVRGLSDFANGTKEKTDRAHWQPKAVANATAFAEALATELMWNSRESRSQNEVENKPAAPAAIRQGASHSSQFVQAGQISGGVTIHAGNRQLKSASPVAGQVEDLRAGLKRAQIIGELDADTTEAAEGELGAVAAALASGSVPLIALKRLRGLVSDVPGLASGVAALLSALDRQP